MFLALFSSLSDICTETSAPFLSCSSPPAVCAAPTEDRPCKESVCMQIIPNDGYRRTEHMSTSQSRRVSHHAKDTPCAQKPSHHSADESCHVQGKCSQGHFQSIFHGRQGSYSETTLRRSSCVGCNINHQSGKTLLACGTLTRSTNLWHEEEEPSIWDPDSFK